MLFLLIFVEKLFSSFLGILKKEDTCALSSLLATTLLSGTIFYSTVEKLSPLDSLYLSLMILTTIGYGDVHPVTNLGKIFTTAYAIVDLRIVATSILVVAKPYLYSK